MPDYFVAVRRSFNEAMPGYICYLHVDASEPRVDAPIYGAFGNTTEAAITSWLEKMNTWIEANPAFDDWPPPSTKPVPSFVVYGFQWSPPQPLATATAPP